MENPDFCERKSGRLTAANCCDKNALSWTVFKVALRVRREHYFFRVIRRNARFMRSGIIPVIYDVGL